jgi:hypothetical protein
MIKARAPSDYMAEIRNTPGFPFDSVLTSHCLPVGDDSPFWSDDYEAFLSWRQNRIWQELCRVTGIVKATNVDDEDGQIE